MNSIIQEIMGFHFLAKGTGQEKYYQFLLDNAVEVKVSPLSDVYTQEEIEGIKRAIKPQMKECFTNAYKLSLYDDRAQYVEGKMSYELMISIEHAFNKIGDKYVDITSELALKDDVTKKDYVVFKEYTPSAVNRLVEKKNRIGGFFNEYMMKEIMNK